MNGACCSHINKIKDPLPGTTVALKSNQGISRDRGVFDLGCPFWVPFGANKKVQNTFCNLKVFEVF